ncbi:ATP-binding protein [bacterium]|jgi:serine/threonine-protein kinase RsbW|nr:ATP-binding protein [bacterium]MBT3582125.1 ATP-binding protein [bacterium]MBT4552858.1 ATP-binding protein [bacterium]MBT5988609.1 ATP-binding protein [bacterium]MBT7087902.1 ATP-binding protein [bacterium]
MSKEILIVEGTLKNLARISQFIEGTMEKYGFDPKKSYGIQMAVDEACSNIINYGYQKQKGKIEITCIKEELKFLINLQDTAAPFDPTTAAAPTLDASAEDRPIGGLGVFFIKKFTDDFYYEYKDHKNNLTLVFNI